MNSLIRADCNMKLKAEWEHKTDNIIVKNVVKTRISQLRKEASDRLEERRIRLAALLNEEERMYQREFHENLETPEQVRGKMAERLAELKSKREEERQNLVQSCYEK